MAEGLDALDREASDRTGESASLIGKSPDYKASAVALMLGGLMSQGDSNTNRGQSGLGDKGIGVQSVTLHLETGTVTDRAEEFIVKNLWTCPAINKLGFTKLVRS